jgi:hypothetical protein
MPDRDEIDLSTFDYRALTLDQINELKSAAFRRAHDARAECMRSVVRRIGALLRNLWAAPGRAWVRYHVHKRWQADIGLTRVDLETLGRRRRD